MSGVNSIGGSSVAQYLQQLAANAGASSSSPLDSSSQSDATQTDAGSTGSSIDFSSLRAQLEAAIQVALQGSTANDAGSALAKITTAVDTTLQAAGIDPAQLKSALSAGAAAATGPAGAQAGQDLISILDALDKAGSSSSSLDDLLASDSGDASSSGATDLTSLLSGVASSNSASSAGRPSVDAAGAPSTDDPLSQLYAQLFQNFPNGSGLDASA